MTTSPMNDDDRPATRGELKVLRTELVGAIHHVVETLGDQMAAMRSDMAAMRDDLSRDLARHVTASAEQTQRLIMGLDDRYRDLPGRVATLERELDAHRRDTALHPRRRR
jgi:hypothetical protein